jgi:hypothetical protein
MSSFGCYVTFWAVCGRFSRAHEGFKQDFAGRAEDSKGFACCGHTHILALFQEFRKREEARTQSRRGHWRKSKR